MVAAEALVVMVGFVWLFSVGTAFSVMMLAPVPVTVKPDELNVSPAAVIGVPNVTVPLGPTNVATSALCHCVSAGELPSHQFAVLVSQVPVPPRPVPLTL